MSQITAILYTSNAGHTKQYAELLSEETKLPVFDLRGDVSSVAKGSAVIYLGWLRAGTVVGFKKAAKMFNVVSLIGVGMMDNGQQIPDILDKNKVTPETKVFSLKGGMEVEKLRGMYKLMMSAASKGMTKRLGEEEDPEEAAKLREWVDGAGNYVCRENLQEVIDWYGLLN